MTAKINLFDKNALLSAMKVAETTIVAATYLRDQSIAILKSAGMEESCAELIEKISEYADLVRLRLSPASNCWSGQLPKGSDYQNMHENLGEETAKLLEQAIKGNLEYAYAINEQGQIRRMFSTDGQPVGEDQLKKLDVLFNAWLATQAGVVSQNSVLYQAAENGSIKMDSKGQPMLADVGKVNELINDPERGFAQYMEEKGFSTTVVQRGSTQDRKAEEKLREEIVAEIEPGSDDMQSGTSQSI